MDFTKCYLEEDLFPKEITSYTEKDYGILFFNEQNKDSYDSNHAIIYKDRIKNLPAVLTDIVAFYKEKGTNPIIYQSMLDNRYFEEIRDELDAVGFDSWIEEQKYMVLAAENSIVPNPKITVIKEEKWRDEFGTEIFIKAEEPWEIDVVKRSLENSNTIFFVAYLKGKPIGMLHSHVTENVCRIDYLLVSKEHRGIGAGRAIVSMFVEFCKIHGIGNCYLWPDGDTPERIYYEAGYRYIETKWAGRASYRK